MMQEVRKERQAATSSMLLILSLFLTILGASNASYQVENQETPIGITVIENQKTKPPGLFVGTSDNNYAIFSPELLKLGWSSIAVNGNRIFIITKESDAITTSLSALNAMQLEVLATVRASFVSNLVGIYLDYPDTYKNYNIKSYHDGLTEKGVVSVASLIGSKVSSNGGLNIASKHSKSGSHSFSAHAVVTGLGIGGVRAVNSVTENKYGVTGSGQTSYTPTYSEINNNRLPPGVVAVDNYKQHGHAYGTNTYNGDASYKCTNIVHKGYLINPVFNYYNIKDTLLKKSLTGDVYYFDFNGNIVDVYSDSVSISRKNSNTLLYRDYSYFTYYRQNMPLLINRFFLYNTLVFFVYNDGSVLVKTSSQLDSTELSLVVPVRNQLKEVAIWLIQAAKHHLEVDKNDKNKKLLEEIEKKEVLTKTTIVTPLEKAEIVEEEETKARFLHEDPDVPFKLEPSTTTKTIEVTKDGAASSKDIPGYPTSAPEKLEELSDSPLDSGISRLVGGITALGSGADSDSEDRKRRSETFATNENGGGIAASAAAAIVQGDKQDENDTENLS